MYLDKYEAYVDEFGVYFAYVDLILMFFLIRSLKWMSFPLIWILHSILEIMRTSIFQRSLLADLACVSANQIHLSEKQCFRIQIASLITQIKQNFIQIKHL
jgi:hypothetical protein